MNKQATLFLVLLAFTVNVAQAVPVTQSQVKLAAKAWVARGGMLGAEIGSAVENVSTLSTTNGAVFYAAKMLGGGTLFLSSDTDYTPILAFTSSKADFSSIDRKSPLWAILNRDVSALKSASSAVARSAAGASLALKMSAMAKTGAELWRALIAEGEAVAGNNIGLNYADPIQVGNPGDLRVGPLVKSKWNQGESNGKACWNYYTPNGKDPSAFVAGGGNNAVCGCVATAMAQIMRYHSYPTVELSPLTRECFWDESSMKLTTQGGIYNWEKMTLDPDSAGVLDAESYQAIGKLTSDAGISVYMQYSSDESGAFSFDISGAMKDYWQYGSAVFFHPSSFDETILAKASRSALYSNFDAGLPVFMGIPGHQIIADGYGFNNDIAYVHLNMGWAGQKDFWYNLPDMTDANSSFNAVDDLVYNVIPSGSQANAVISGRTLDDEGGIIAGCIVELYKDGGVLATQVVSSARGVWGAVVERGTYTVVAYQDEVAGKSGELESVTVSGPNPVNVTWNGMRTVPTVSSAAGLGNSWGNDITLSNPSVRIGTEFYNSLDKALAAAENMTDPVLEIVSATELRRPVDIDFSCVIVSVEAEPALTPVMRRADAGLTVVAGGALTLSNVVFGASSVPPVNVASGGRVAVAGDLDFGVSDGVAALTVTDADAFEIVGEIKRGFSLDCKAAKNVGQAFGTLTGLTAEQATNTAARIVNFNNDSGDDILGSVTGTTAPFVLVWDEVPVPFDECSCYYVDDAGVTNTSTKIDRLLGKFENQSLVGNVSPGTEIVVRKSGKLTREIVVGVDIAVRGENGAVLDVAGFAGFSVTNGTLAVQGLGFENYKGNALFYVNGGDLVLDNGVSITGAIGTGYHSGAVAVMKGSATLGPGITIADCGFEYYGNGNGAGVYVNQNATLNFFGGTITGCVATGNGGGIYVNKKGHVNLKGEIDISGNRKYGQQSVLNNIYVLDGGTSKITLVGAVSGSVGIAYSGSSSVNKNRDGAVFADIDANLPDSGRAEIARNAAAFSCDVDPALNATLSSGLQGVSWTGDDVAAGVVPSELVAHAYARVVKPGGDTVYYWSVADALAAVDTDASSVEMLRDDSFAGEVSLANSEVRLVSVVEGAAAEITGGTVVVSGSLAVSNVVLSGESLFNIAGGMLFVEDAVVNEIGCTGGSAADPMLFATVRCDLDYESLTNSAANFRNAELGAYGVAVTNAADTAIVWSKAVESDGTFRHADGTVWGCVGEIPVNEIPVAPLPIGFGAIVRDVSDGTWSITLTNLVRGCWYSLYATNSLAGGFVVGEGVCDPVTNFQAEADGDFIFRQEGDGSSMFWKAIGEDGVIND